MSMLLQRVLPRITAVVLCAAASIGASATQHLVAPGEDWSRLASRVKPGDEIILMPGRHKPASFTDLRGEANRPIIIRSVTPDAPAVIVADSAGVEFIRPFAVILQDVQITAGTRTGIRATDGHMGEEVAGDPYQSGFRIRRVTISRIGPEATSDAIRIWGLADVQVDQLTVHGWGGAAVEIVGCREVTIERSRFLGDADFEQVSGVEVRGGSQAVSVIDCVFRDCGEASIALGGHSARREFRPSLPEAPDTKRPRFEASRVQVDRCEVVGGRTSFSLIGAQHVVINACTIVNPGASLFRFGATDPNAPVSPNDHVTLDANLLTWKPATLQALFAADDTARPATLNITDNLWWSPGESAQLADRFPVEPALPQTLDVDPRLDREYRPTDPAATPYGRHAGGAAVTRVPD
jgi:hypothetical protein